MTSESSGVGFESAPLLSFLLRKGEAKYSFVFRVCALSLDFAGSC